MTKFIIIGIFKFFFCLCADVYSQDEVILFSKEISAGDYRIVLTANSDTFFSGSLELIDKYNNSVLYVDNLYSGYNSDTLIDLNRDGKVELILNLGTGATMYDYNMFLIFDFTLDTPLTAEVHNAEFAKGSDGKERILSYVRMSPAVMGAGYTFPLRYENGSLILDTDALKADAMTDQDSVESDILYLINEFSKETDECDDERLINNYFLSYVLQQKISGAEDKGWEFFDKYYTCSDREKVRTVMKEDVDKIYNYINNPANYQFSSKRY